MSPPPVLVHGNATEHADELLTPVRDALADQEVDFTVDQAELRRAEGLLTWGIDADAVDRASALRWVQALNAGVDDYPLDELRRRDVVLTNCSGVHAEPMAEQVLGYLLVFERRLHEGLRQQRAGEWDPYVPGELADKTVGIVGVGAIGRRVAELTKGIGMEVVGTKRHPTDGPETVDTLWGLDGLEKLLSRSDYVVLTCPLTDETRGLLGAGELDLMAEDAVLVNVARGAVVDEAALTVALEAGRIRGAALDVFETEPLPAESPLRGFDSVVMTPHTAGRTPRYYDRAAPIIADNCRAFHDGDRDAYRNRVL